jgi:hypothetical protein
MIGRIHTAVFGLVAGLGLTAAAAGTVPAAVAAVAAGLENAAYTDVLVTERIFGGFAIEGTKGADFAMIIVDAQGMMLDHAELFRDADGDGVFETNETLGLPGRNTLRDLIFEALAAPADPTEREVNFGTLDTAGFGQNMESLFATGGLRLNAGQRLGSGNIALLDESLSLDGDSEGLQRRGDSQTQLQTMTGLGILTLSATATNRGSASGTFAPLMINLPGTVTSGVNAEDIRSSVTSNIPDAKALGNSITAVAPSAAALTEQIMFNAPTAESIRATTTAPMTPKVP